MRNQGKGKIDTLIEKGGCTWMIERQRKTGIKGEREERPKDKGQTNCQGREEKKEKDNVYVYMHSNIPL